ncbi:hypothetical protein Nepgr_033392 [Nepenthes gracilis]|uniref:S phase cyclin A-associated protein in the endoplasmic reticulum N-terminal domain-containing protein n=1 Tax=Nepenthes gracilis TaxID=150966 RepID=A0AAD3TKJ1_NEPGR|nr:hypothetical protein Nepgr_033392 [Nepenthes gracilis]
MENAEEAEDDQGSGWFEVKKKHRSSSKFSVQNLVGGYARRLMDGNGGNAWDKQGGHPLKSRRDFSGHVKGDISNYSSVSEANVKSENCLDKCVVSEENECLNTLGSRHILVRNCNGRAIDIQNVSYKKPGVVHKIKWGDIDSDAFGLHHENQAASEIKFGEIGDADLALCRMSQNANDVVSCASSHKCTEVNIEVVKANDTVCDAQQIPMDGSFGENCKELNEISLSITKATAKNGEIADGKCYIPDDKELLCEEVEPMNNDSMSAGEFSCVAVGEAVTEGEVQAPMITSSVDDMEVLKVPTSNGSSSTLGINQDSDLAPFDDRASEIPGESNLKSDVEDFRALHSSSQESNKTYLAEDYRGLPNDKTQDSVSRDQIMCALGEGPEGESKERFRERLWCFLFENLNRAVDELYLLCELECDLEQVKESILVLEEAASDFRELNTRVEKFEILKGDSSKLTDGAMMTIKNDHRRPHALSWEVRRMTTSPHRAEILSSSLEAFKKIQQARGKMHATGDVITTGSQRHSRKPITFDVLNSSAIPDAAELEIKLRRQSNVSIHSQVNLSREKRSIETGRSTKVNWVRNNRVASQSPCASDLNTHKLPLKASAAAVAGGKSRRELVGSSIEVDKNSNAVDQLKRQRAISEKEKGKEKKSTMLLKSMDAWKEKRNWEEIIASPCRVSSRVSHSPFINRKSAERARILHDKLMSPEKKKKTAWDLKKEAEEKHARAMRIRSELENERVQKLQRTSEKLNRVNEWQAVRTTKLREGVYARHQRGESRHEAYIAQVVKRAGDESIKVNEVRFITSLNEENKKFVLRQKLHDSQMRRAEKLQVLKTKQKEDVAREEAAFERRKLIEAEKLQRLSETQRKKEEAQVRREEERKASSAAREAKAIEQLKRREERAKVQQEEAELLAQKLAERLSESEQRRKFYLEQIREKASMDFRDQSSPLLRRLFYKEGPGRSTPTNNGEDNPVNNSSSSGDSCLTTGCVETQNSLKRRIKKIRQRLMALKHGLPEPAGTENSGIGYRTAVATARAKIARWLQDLQRHRQERKEGASSIGLITAEMIKFLEGKELELQASRQAGLLDFISSALPASHISKPEACRVTIYLLKLLRVVLSVPANRSYFLAQNLLPPIIPMLSAALESYIRIAASLNSPGSNLLMDKTSSENIDSVSEVLDGFLWAVTMIIGQATSDGRQILMQDGLLELVISYQIIHRLRDLFALYDRPQAEGSPFPSSIPLSINLLVALTSRSRMVSFIDWESFTIVRENDILLTSKEENADSGSHTVSDLAKMHESSSSVRDGSSVTFDSLAENDVGGQLCKIKTADGSILTAVDFWKDPSNNAIELNGVDMGTRDVHESLKSPSLGILKSSISINHEKDAGDIGIERKNVNPLDLKQPQFYLLSAISKTGLVSLLSLLTAVLLQAKLSSEQASYVLPSNFEEVATGVLKVLNNLALMDISFIQQMLARLDLKMEFFHVMSFLLMHCTTNWKTAGDQIGLLLFESLLILGYFSLFHSGNQAVLRWGKGPTILHKLCDLPFVFFSDLELMPVLAGTLVAACFQCEQNKGVVQQELSTEMLLSLIRSCKAASPVSRSGNSRRNGKLRNHMESKLTRSSEEVNSKQKIAASEAASALMLHSRFPASFIDRTEQFFAAELSVLEGEASV